jgi:bacteriocin biosynthesis cyclodehydratase domain-containing protein
MTSVIDTSASALLRLRAGTVVEQRTGEVAIYLPDLGGGSVLRGIPALMFSSVYRRFASEPFTVDQAAADLAAGNGDTWRRVLSALKDRAILTSESTARGSVSAPTSLRIFLQGSDADATRMAALVAALPNVQITDDDGANLAVRVDDQLDTSGSLEFARNQAQRGRQSLTVRIYGHNVELGPWTIPRRTPCFDCYWQRLQAGREQEPPGSLVGAGKPRKSQNDRPRSLAAQAAMILLASEIGKAATGAPPVALGQVVQLELTSLEIVKHRVIAVPACPTCAVSR